MNNLKTYFEKLGPGFLFAASCVGTSHLVQSTRAGADYGLALWWVILLACLIKYPAFSFGSAYAAATKSSLIESYFRQGRWAVICFALELFANMFIATAAVALITGGLLNNVLDFGINPVLMASGLLIACSLLLISGKYHLLERVTKGFVVVFTLLILIAVMLALPEMEFRQAQLLPTVEMDVKTLLFIIALAGWMPTAMGASTFQSLWVCAKSKDLGRAVTPSEARLDFNVGFGATVFLAFCFLVLGAVFMHQEGVVVAGSAAGFSGQFIGLFTASIGEWAYPLIAIAAVAIMLSTLLTLMDACPRGLSKLSSHYVLSEQVQSDGAVKFYTPLILLQCVGSIMMLVFFMHSFKAFIDFATSVAFLVAPLIAFINHRAMFADNVPSELQPGSGIRLWSIAGIMALSVFALAYLYFGILS